MTLHAFNRLTNKSMKWVAVPLEFVDWMATHFQGAFISFLRHVDPYKDILVPEDVITSATTELRRVRDDLSKRGADDVPAVVDILGEYGMLGALSTLDEMIAFVEFAIQSNCKIVSVGD